MLDLLASSVQTHWSKAYKPRIEFYEDAARGHVFSEESSREALERIRKESDIIKTHQARLNECENALLPVSKLAPEILSHVFFCLGEVLPLVTEDAKTHDFEFNPHHLLRSWTRVLYVSRHFRRTALSDPSLWPDITTALGMDWMHKLVALSGSTPINFHVGGRIRDMEAVRVVQAAIVKVVGRMRSLHVNTGFSGLRVFRRAFDASTLEILHILGVLDPYPYGSPTLSAYEIHLPLTWSPALFAGSTMPKLRELSIHGFRNLTDLSALIQPTISVLRIGPDKEFDDIVQLPRLDALLAMLSRLPQLAELSLEGCIIDHIRPGTSPVTFPNLRELRISNCEHITVATLFSLLHTPSEAKLHLSTDVSQFNHPTELMTLEQANEVSSFFETLRRCLESPTWQDVRTVELVTTPEKYPEMYSDEVTGRRRYRSRRTETFAINVWRADDSRIVCADCERKPRTDSVGYSFMNERPFTYVRYVRPEPDLIIEFPNSSHIQHPFCLIDYCLTIFKGKPIHALSFHVDSDVLEPGSWVKRLDGFESLKFLRADGMLGQTILEALYSLGIDYKRTPPSNSPRSQHLPELKVIAFLRDGGDVHWRSSPVADGCRDRLQLLAKVWQLRSDNGNPLREVVLDERRCTLPHFQSLADAVKIRPVHLWDFGHGSLKEEILSSELGYDDRSSDDDNEMYWS